MSAFAHNVRTAIERIIRQTRDKLDTVFSRATPQTTRAPRQTTLDPSYTVETAVREVISRTQSKIAEIEQELQQPNYVAYRPQELQAYNAAVWCLKEIVPDGDVPIASFAKSAMTALWDLKREYQISAYDEDGFMAGSVQDVVVLLEYLLKPLADERGEDSRGWYGKYTYGAVRTEPNL